MISPRQEDVAEFYNEASLVLNLTNPHLAVETFGLTPLETMSCGLPVIVPAVGGIAEMVEDGGNGYKINVQDIEIIRKRIDEILSVADLYNRLSKGALQKARDYDCICMIEQIEEILNRA